MNYKLLWTFIGALPWLLFTSCDQKSAINDNTFFNTKVIILGHRGMGVNYYKPTNTIESILPLIEIGADGSELDVQMTKDSILVLFHGNTLQNTTTCIGRIYEHTWNEIKACKYLALQNNIFINSVEEVFNQLPNLQKLYFSFDCKTDNEVLDRNAYQYQYLRAIKRICEKHNLTQSVFIEADEELLTKAQELEMKNPLFLFKELSIDKINAANQMQLFGMSVDMEKLNENIELAHNKGLRIMTWSPNNYSQNLNVLNQHVDIIQTDDPISLLKYLERYDYDYIIP